jgi:hypothetical protein
VSACSIATVRKVGPHKTLRRCEVHGVAFVADGTAGIAHSAHPNVDASGNPRAVFGKDARVVRCNGFAYNTDDVIVSDVDDQIAADNCRCGGRHDNRDRQYSKDVR